MNAFITIVAALALLLTITTAAGACFSSGTACVQPACAYTVYGPGTVSYLGCPGCPGCPDNPAREPGEPGCYYLGCPGCPGCPDGNATPANPGGPGCMMYGCL